MQNRRNILCKINNIILRKQKINGAYSRIITGIVALDPDYRVLRTFSLDQLEEAERWCFEHRGFLSTDRRPRHGG